MSVAAIAPPGSGSPQLAELVEQGLIGRGAFAGPVGRASERLRSTGVDRVIPLRPELCPLVPWQGLRRGATVAVATGGEQRPVVTPGAAGSTSLLLALLTEAVRAGSWCGVVGVPALGAAAAAEQGIDLGRLALVPYPGTEWVTVAAALLDGLDIVVVCPPGPVAPALARRLAARAKQRGGVLVSYGGWDGAEVTLRVAGQVWHGLGAGRGRLRARELDVVSYGRGAAARTRRVRLRLPEHPGNPTQPDLAPHPLTAAPDPEVAEAVGAAS
ncbi:MAG: hypothetical protein ACRDTU_07325 [Micromonosporaceae bacterium]